MKFTELSLASIQLFVALDETGVMSASRNKDPVEHYRELDARKGFTFCDADCHQTAKKNERYRLYRELLF